MFRAQFWVLVYMAGFIEYLIPIGFIKCRQIDVFG